MKKIRTIIVSPDRVIQFFSFNRLVNSLKKYI